MRKGLVGHKQSEEGDGWARVVERENWLGTNSVRRGMVEKPAVMKNGCGTADMKRGRAETRMG